MPSAVPPKILYSLTGVLMATVCTPEAGCVRAPVRLLVQVYSDDTWHAAYYDPDDPMINDTAGGLEASETDSLVRMLQAISTVAMAPSQPVMP